MYSINFICTKHINGTVTMRYMFRDTDGNFTTDMRRWGDAAQQDGDPCVFTAEEVVDILTTETFAEISFEPEDHHPEYYHACIDIIVKEPSGKMIEIGYV